MHYTSTTPTLPDLDHVIAVIGLDRLLANLGKPVAEWGLTPDECERIRRGPHGQRGVYFLDSEYYGFTVQEWSVECECGTVFADRLLSNAMSAYDAHAGTVVSHVHTAQLLEK